ncbi:pentapeptide repeat-containing protein [Symbiopectobacterium sp. Eva_TO]
MNINGTSPSTLLNCLSAAGTGTEIAIKEAKSPKGIIELIINVFTFGSITRANDKFYNQIVDMMVNALTWVNEKDIQDGMCIFLNDINGCKVVFSVDEINSNHVNVEVQKDHYIERCKIDSQRFFDVCRTLILRNELNIPQHPVILTDSGKMNLRGANLANQDFKNINLSNADLSNANLFRANLIGVNMTSADLSNANLERANLAYADLSSTNLSSADLASANLYDVDLCYADLSCANLSGTDLSNADLSCADLSCADLSCANLSGADLSQVDLTCANLVNTKLDHDALTFAKKHPGANLNTRPIFG